MDRLLPLKLVLRERVFEESDDSRSGDAQTHTDILPEREYYLHNDLGFEFLNLKAPKSGKYEVLLYTKNSK